MGKFSGVLLASDFDNTLTDSMGALRAGVDIPPLAPRNREALEYFTAEGGLFSVATGRALPAIAPYLPQLPVNAPCVVGNGAGIYDFAQQRYLVTAFLAETAKPHLQEVMDAFPTLGIELYLQDSRTCALRVNDYIRAHFHLTRAAYVEVDGLDEVEFPISKALFEAERPLLDEVVAFLDSRSWKTACEYCFSADHLLELTAPGATKGGMVLRLADLLGVKRENIYCAGDHGNDLSMLAVAAEGFAPANAIDAVRSSGATLVCAAAEGAMAEIIALLDQRYR